MDANVAAEIMDASRRRFSRDRKTVETEVAASMTYVEDRALRIFQFEGGTEGGE